MTAKIKRAGACGAALLFGLVSSGCEIGTITFTPEQKTSLVNAAAPSIIEQPKGASYVVGSEATELAVKARSPDGGKLSYQWYRNNTLDVTGAEEVTGATKAILQVDTASAGSNYYYVAVTNTNEKVNGDRTATISSAIAPVMVIASGEEPFFVVFESHGGTFIKPIVGFEGVTVSRPKDDPVRTGYAFRGWYYDEESDERPVEWPFILGAVDITIHAHWTPNPHTVIWKNGETVLETDEDVAYGTTPSYEGAPPSRESTAQYEFVFSGWEPEIAPVTGDAEYAARFDETPRSYDIIYDPNGGDTTPAQVTKNYNESISLAAAITRTGFTFFGWKEGASGPVKLAGDSYTVTGETVFTAQWTPNAYTVVFNANGGGAPGFDSQQVTYGETYGVLAPVSRRGYGFAGWYTAAEGGTEITSADTVSITAAQTLYAHWTPVTYTVAYDGNGSDGGATASSSHTYDVAANLAANGFTRTGYTFDGWAESGSGPAAYAGGQSVVNLLDTEGVKTLYAHWHKDSAVTVTLTGVAAAQTITLGVSGALDWSANSSLTVSVDTGEGQWARGASFTWYADGALIDGTTNEKIVYARNYLPGTHTLSVKVTKGGDSYSKTVVFEVEE